MIVYVESNFVLEFAFIQEEHESCYLTTESGEPRCFITTNSKDFSNPDVEQQLTSRNCKLLTKFGNGLGYIRSR